MIQQKQIKIFVIMHSKYRLIKLNSTTTIFHFLPPVLTPRLIKIILGCRQAPQTRLIKRSVHPIFITLT
jgi:hypothetical protein